MLKVFNHNIILPKYLEVVKKKGSSFLFSALGGRGKEKERKARRKNRRQKRGRGGRGVWGEFRLARAEAKPRRPARSEQNPAKKFFFPFRRKRNRAPNQKMRRKLFAEQRAKRGN